MELDTTKYQAQMRALLQEMPQVFAAEVLMVEARELIKRVLSFLPPKTRSQGRSAVKRDIDRTMQGLDASTFTDPTIRKIILSGDVAAIQRLVDVSPKYAGMVVALFDSALHTSKRSRYGRVAATNKPALVPQPTMVKNYTTSVQNRVGLLKSGYAPAAASLGLALPAWVRSHGSGLGGYDLKVTSAAGTQMLTITHRSGKWPDHRRTIQDALGYRVEAMKKKVALYTAGKWVNLGGTIGRVGG